MNKSQRLNLVGMILLLTSLPERLKVYVGMLGIVLVSIAILYPFKEEG